MAVSTSRSISRNGLRLLRSMLPILIASSASRTWRDEASLFGVRAHLDDVRISFLSTYSSTYTATDRMLSFRQVWIMRHEISPRFAMRTFWIIGRPSSPSGGSAMKSGLRRGDAPFSGLTLAMLLGAVLYESSNLRQTELITD